MWEAQQRVERSEWRVGLNNNRRYLLVRISSLSPETIVTSLGRSEIALLIRFSYFECTCTACLLSLVGSPGFSSINPTRRVVHMFQEPQHFYMIYYSILNRVTFSVITRYTLGLNTIKPHWNLSRY